MNNKKILGVYNFWVYLIGCLVSIAFIAIGFIKEERFIAWTEVFLYIGTSGIGAVVLAYFIELSNNKRDEKKIQEFRKNQINIFNGQIEVLLLRTVYYFFEYYKLLYDDYSPKKIYKLSYNDIVNGFSEIEKTYNSLLLSRNLDDEKEDKILKVTKNLISCYSGISTVLSLINQNITLYEVNGFFTHDEKNSFSSLECLLNNLWFHEDIPSENIKVFYSILFEIKEFERIKNYNYYYFNMEIVEEKHFETKFKNISLKNQAVNLSFGSKQLGGKG